MAVILFIIMVAVVLGAEWLVSNRRKATAGAALPRSISVEGLSLADGLFYSPGHSWAALDADGTLAIGADDMLLRLAGKLDGVGLPARSIAVSKGEPLFSLKVGGRSISVPSPIDGVVEAVNADVEQSPTLLSVPRDGWAVRIRPKALAEGIHGMSIGAKARAWFEAEMTRLRDFFAALSAQHAPAMATLQDGGSPVEGALSHLDDEALARFQNDFLAAR